MPVNPLRVNNFLDSCAFDPKYEPENKAAQEIYQWFERGELLLQIAHSTKKEIEHPNTPKWVKDLALQLIYTLSFNLTLSELDLLRKLETILAGNGKVENVAQDVRHIFEAQKYGSYFITTDSTILRHAEEIRSICHVTILKPSEFLEIVQQYTSLKSESSSKGPYGPDRSSEVPSQNNVCRDVSYKGFLIMSAPWHLYESMKWRPNLTILHKNGKAVRYIDPDNTFDTEEEATQASVEIGKRIIDRRIPGCRVDNL